MQRTENESRNSMASEQGNGGRGADIYTNCQKVKHGILNVLDLKSLRDCEGRASAVRV